jgi:ankyrin repeat protein
MVVDPYALLKLCEHGGSGDVGEARDLIARGININEQGEGQYTALMLAAWMNRIELVKVLVRADAVLNLQNVDGATAVMFAVVQNRIEVVKELVRVGAALDMQNNDGQTTLMHAAVLNRIEMVKELMRAGAALDVQNKNGITALMFAAVQNRIEVVKELVRAGAALDVQDKQGKTALQWAQEKGLTEIVAILEKAARERIKAAGGGKARGSDAKEKNDGEGGAGGGGAGGDLVGIVDPYALIKLCEYGGSDDVGEARDLIARGVNIDEHDDEYQRTALMLAAAMNRIEIVKELVRVGAALDMQNVAGKTALQWAQEKGLTKTVVFLEQATQDRGEAAGEGKARDGDANGDT